MTLQQLIYFRELARNRDQSLTQTAKDLYISQPTLSHSVATLEKELGVPLFQRGNQRLSLSRNGETFLCRVDGILQQLDDAVAEVRAMGQDTGTPHAVFGCVSGLADAFLSEFLREYFRDGGRDPGGLVLIHRREEKLAEMMERGEVDLALCARPKYASADCCPLFSEEICLYVDGAHPLAGRNRISVKELNGIKLVKLLPDNMVQITVDRFLAAHSIIYQTATEQESLEDAAVFVENGFGAGLFPAVPALQRCGLHGIRLEDASLVQTIYLAWRKDAPLKEGLGRLRDFLVEHGSEIGRNSGEVYFPEEGKENRPA